MKPDIIIDGLSGLSYDDHCVVYWRRPVGGEWEKIAYIPHRVAVHVSAYAALEEQYSTGLKAAHAVINQYLEGGRITDNMPEMRTVEARTREDTQEAQH